MTLFEYLSVAFSLVLSLGVVRLLGGLPAALLPERRYWLHVFYIGLLLLGVAMVWWNLWAYRLVAAWTFFGFGLVLLTPALIYFAAALLVPEGAREVDSWRDHFYAIRIRFFATGFLIFTGFFLNSWLLLNVPVLHPVHLSHGASAACALTGCLTSRHRVHEAIGLAILLIALTSLVFIYARPDAVTS